VLSNQISTNVKDQDMRNKMAALLKVRL